MVHPVDEGERLVDIAWPAPVVDCVIDEILICQAHDGGLLWRELTVDELDFRLLEHLRDLLNRSQCNVHLP